MTGLLCLRGCVRVCPLHDAFALTHLRPDTLCWSAGVCQCLTQEIRQTTKTTFSPTKHKWGLNLKSEHPADLLHF